MPVACYECGKAIKGKAVHIVPSNLAISLGRDFPRSYHSACYAKLGREAAKVLKKRRK
jgi:hypothetical protein